MNEFIGKNGNNLIWKCSEGFIHITRMYSFSSGCLMCEHSSGETHFDYVNPDEIKDMTLEEVDKLRRIS